MSETDNEKPQLGMRAPLGLKRTVETGQVKQSFSHGRSNTVIVETKRRRVLRPGDAAPATPEQTQTPTPAAPAPVVAKAPPPRPAPADNLSAQERQAKLLREAEEQRLHLQEEARRREDAERVAAVEEEKRRAEDNRRAEEEAAKAPVTDTSAAND